MPRHNVNIKNSLIFLTVTLIHESASVLVQKTRGNMNVHVCTRRYLYFELIFMCLDLSKYMYIYVFTLLYVCMYVEHGMLTAMECVQRH